MFEKTIEMVDNDKAVVFHGKRVLWIDPNRLGCTGRVEIVYNGNGRNPLVINLLQIKEKLPLRELSPPKHL